MRLSISESKKKKETKKIPNHIIGNVRFSLAESEDKGDGGFQNLNRDSEIGNFDYALVPEGLIAFTKAINILSNTIGRSFSYWIKEINESYSFSRINDTIRKAIIVKFDIGTPIYFVEVDSSDNRFISTLLFHSINTPDHKNYINLVLEHNAKNHGRWPEGEITKVSQYITIRHPQSREKEKDLPENEKLSHYIKRIAWKYLSIFHS